MATDGWIEFDGRELVNLSRTAQLAESMGIDVVWTSPESVEWIEDALGGVGYSNVANAPWYDPGYPASAEFAGVLPVSFAGLDDSSGESTPVEYTGDGGYSGRLRNSTQAIPAKVYLVASTDRGAEYGKKWLDRVLRGGQTGNCSGYELRYFRYPSEDAPQMHRRDVQMTRAAQVIGKRSRSCSVSWVVTFTLTDADGYEYGDAQQVLTGLGGATPGGGALSSGTLNLTHSACPVFDYSPLYDPLRPALVASPTAPYFYPDGWDMPEGRNFKRYWALVPSIEPTTLLSVPLLTLVSDVAARMVRVSIWPGDTVPGDLCDPLFQVVLSYLPPGNPGGPTQQFIIDGEQKASYVYGGLGTQVRRTDSLVYGTEAEPLQWSAFSDPLGLLVTLDTFEKTPANGGGYEGDGTIRASLSLVPKSD